MSAYVLKIEENGVSLGYVRCPNRREGFYTHDVEKAQKTHGLNKANERAMKYRTMHPTRTVTVEPAP